MDNKKITRILFVCLGNICRSPAAEALMRQLVERSGMAANIDIDSAGTYGDIVVNVATPACVVPQQHAA